MFCSTVSSSFAYLITAHWFFRWISFGDSRRDFQNPVRLSNAWPDQPANLLRVLISPPPPPLQVIAFCVPLGVDSAAAGWLCDWRWLRLMGLLSLWYRAHRNIVRAMRWGDWRTDRWNSLPRWIKLLLGPGQSWARSLLPADHHHLCVVERPGSCRVVPTAAEGETEKPIDRVSWNMKWWHCVVLKNWSSNALWLLDLRQVAVIKLFTIGAIIWWYPPPPGTFSDSIDWRQRWWWLMGRKRVLIYSGNDYVERHLLLLGGYSGASCFRVPLNKVGGIPIWMSEDLGKLD